MSTTAIKLKKSSVVGKAPTDSDLSYGEVAINYADGRLYYKNSSNVIKNFVDSDLVINSINAGDALQLSLTGGTMSGIINMGLNRITSLGTPSFDQDAATKLYVDNAVLGIAEAGGFPTGDYGLVDSVANVDAFGINFGAEQYDCLDTPINQLLEEDLGTDSSI
jgi:hypothetical protein